MTCGKACKRVWTLIGNAIRYNAIRSAVVVKFLQSVAQLSGHTPWGPDKAAAVEAVIDGLVMILVVAGVGQAHENQP